MTERALPHWPRLLSVEQAASYVGISKTTFLNGVGRAWPKSIRHGKRVLWDRTRLDRTVDAMSGLAPSSSPAEEDDSWADL